MVQHLQQRLGILIVTFAPPDVWWFFLRDYNYHSGTTFSVIYRPVNKPSKPKNHISALYQNCQIILEHHLSIAISGTIHVIVVAPVERLVGF